MEGQRQFPKWIYSGDEHCPRCKMGFLDYLVDQTITGIEMIIREECPACGYERDLQIKEIGGLKK